MTYADLLAALSSLTPEQLQQPIQCVLPTPNDDDVQECLPGILFDTVANLGFRKIRSTHDNRYHGDDFVLLLDHNLFDKIGAICYRWKDIADDSAYTRKPLSTDQRYWDPIYGPDGPTDVAQQTCPNPSDLVRCIAQTVYSAIESKVEHLMANAEACGLVTGNGDTSPTHTRNGEPS